MNEQRKMKGEIMPNTNNNRINSLQSIRAIAFLGILTSHCGATELGAWGVSVFLVLSGFVMFFSYQDKILDMSLMGSLRFSVNKIKKLYPLHILMMLSALYFVFNALAKSFSVKSLIFQSGKLVLNTLLLQTWIPSSSVYFSLNGVAWYLSVCLFLYAFFPLVLCHVKKANLKQSVIGILSVFCIQIMIGFLSQFTVLPGDHFDNYSKWVIYILPLFRLGDFLIGCFVGKIYIDKKITINKYIASVLEVVVVILIFVSEWIYVNKIGFLGSEWFRYTMLFTPSSVCLIYLFAINKGFVSKISVVKPLLYIGNLSAYTFLIHLMVIKYLDTICNRLINIGLTPWIKVVVALLITIVLAEIYKRIESILKGQHKR